MDINYLQSFPYEVLEHICYYLNTIDVIKLSDQFTEFESVSCSKRIIEKVNLFREYYITRKHIGSFFAVKPKCSFIVSLNLSCLYWIPAADIRKCILPLENLECLYVVDTKMGLLRPDLLVYSKISRLKKLGVSVTKRTFCKESLKLFPKVTHFYLHLDSDADVIIRHLMLVLKKYKCVEEFWLIESATICFTNLSHITIPSSVTKFNSLLHNIYFCNEELNQMERIHRNMFTRMEMCWEKRDHPIKRFFNIEFDKNWNTFFDLSRTNIPFTPKQTREIFDKQSLDDVNFDEINFAHDPTVCGDTYKGVTEKLLLENNMKQLIKLAINFCACISDDETTELELSSNNVKRQKRDNMCFLNKLAENCPNIEELELWPCLRVNGCSKITSNTCNSITNFKYLKKLTLDNLPIHINGSFLINVFSSCKYLSSLRIKSKQQNTSLHNMLCISLKYATALKDFRYEHPCNISIDKLLLALADNKNLKLERLFVKCKSVEIFSAKPIHIFLEMGTNLKFFYLVITDLPKSVIKQTMKSLEKYNDDPRKILLITNNEYLYNGRTQIPFIHTYEMVLCLTHVSGLDVFNGYIRDN